MKTKDAYRQAMEMENRLMSTSSHLAAEKLQAFAEVKNHGSLSEIRELVEQAGRDVLEYGFVEGLIMGNANEEIAVSMTESLVQTLELKRNFDTTCTWGAYVPDKALGKEITLKKDHANPNDDNNALTLFLYFDENNPKTNAYGSVLSQMISQKFFDSLRTKQQFGYIVSSYLNQISGRLTGMGFLVQTGKSLSEARTAVNLFIDETWERMLKVDPEEVEKYKNAVLQLLKKKYVRLEEEYRDMQREVDRRRFQWDIKREVIAEVEDMNAESLVKFVRDYCVNAPRIYSEVARGGGDFSEDALKEENPSYTLETIDEWRVGKDKSVWETRIDGGIDGIESKM